MNNLKPPNNLYTGTLNDYFDNVWSNAEYTLRRFELSLTLHNMKYHPIREYFPHT